MSRPGAQEKLQPATTSVAMSTSWTRRCYLVAPQACLVCLFVSVLFLESSRKYLFKPGMVVHTSNPSSWEAETSRFLSRGQLDLHSKFQDN